MMHSIRMGMPSPGMFGMNLNCTGKEYRNYKIKPLEEVKEHNDIFYENVYNEAIPLSVLKQGEPHDGKRDIYEDIQETDGGALIHANAAGLMRAAGVMKAAGIDDDESQLEALRRVARRRNAIKKFSGRGIAFNKNELNKLRTGGSIPRTTIRKGMDLNPQIYKALLKARKGGSANVRKLLRPSRMKKYIGVDESTGRVFVKRGGAWWGALLSAIPGIVDGVTKTVNYFKNRKNQGNTPSNILDTVSNVANNFKGINSKADQFLGTISNTANTINNLRQNRPRNFSGVINGVNQVANNFKGLNANMDRVINGVNRTANFLTGTNPTGTGNRCKKGGKQRLSKAEFLRRMRLGKERARRLRGRGCGIFKRSKDENLIQESMECDNPIVSDESRNVKPYSFKEFKQKLLSYTNVPGSLIKPIYNYGYLNKPTSAVACAKADSVMNLLSDMNDESFKYYDSYEEFEALIDKDQTTYSIIFHTNPSDPNHGHFEACIYHNPQHIEWYSSLGNQPTLSEEFIQSHEIRYSNIQHQKTSSNANGCFWYCLLYLCSKSNILPC